MHLVVHHQALSSKILRVMMLQVPRVVCKSWFFKQGDGRTAFHRHKPQPVSGCYILLTAEQWPVWENSIGKFPRNRLLPIEKFLESFCSARLGEDSDLEIIPMPCCLHWISNTEAIIHSKYYLVINYQIQLVANTRELLREKNLLVRPILTLFF